MKVMPHIRQFDHVGVTVVDLDSGLVGGIGEHENWRMAHVRRPEGIVVSLTERID